MNGSAAELDASAHRPCAIIELIAIKRHSPSPQCKSGLTLLFFR